MAELNSSQKPGDDNPKSGLYGLDGFSFDISSLVDDCQPVKEVRASDQFVQAASVPQKPQQPEVVEFATVAIPVSQPAPTSVSPLQASTTVGEATVAEYAPSPVATDSLQATPFLSTDLQASVPHPIPDVQPAPPLTIIPELASLSPGADEFGYSRLTTTAPASDSGFVPIVISAPPAAPPSAHPGPAPVPSVVAPGPASAPSVVVPTQDSSFPQQGEPLRQYPVSADLSPQLKLDLIPPRPIVTEPAPAIAPIAVTPTLQQPLPPTGLPEPIAVREQPPTIQPAPSVGPALLQTPNLIQETVIPPAKPSPVNLSFGMDAQLAEPPAPATLPLQVETLEPMPVVAAKQTSEAPDPSPLSRTFLETVGSIDFDDADIEPVEPASDWRWQGNKILLPLDRPLPKIEGQGPQASPVTPVQELPDVTKTFVPEQLRETATPETVPVTPQGRDQTLIPELAKMSAENTAVPTQASQAVATPVASPAQQPVIRSKFALDPPVTAPQPAPVAAPLSQATPQPAQTAASAPVAAPVLQPAPQPASVVAPIPQAAPAPASVAAPAAQTVPVAVVTPVTVLSHEAAGPLPVTPIATPVAGGALIKDEALDIEDAEEDGYYKDEDEDEGKSSYSGPRFIVILIIILVLEMFFVLLLVNMGVIDPGAIADFWGGLFS